MLTCLEVGVDIVYGADLLSLRANRRHCTSTLLYVLITKTDHQLSVRVNYLSHVVFCY